MPATRKRNVNRKQKKGKGKGRGKTMKVMIVAAVPCHPSIIKKMRGGKGKGMRGGMHGGAWPFPDAPTNNSTPTPSPQIQEVECNGFQRMYKSNCKPFTCPPGETPGKLWGCSPIKPDEKVKDAPPAQ